MKKTKYIIILIAGSVLFSACKKDFFTEVNDNPNAPPTANMVPYALLSTVEGALAYTQGSTHSFMVSMLTQQTQGFSRQAYAYDQYVFTSQDFDDPWSNWYTAVMENNKKLMELADGKGYNQYSGVSRILMAYSLMVVVDSWGSIPYSNALLGDALVLHPTYDSDSKLYETIGTLCDQAITYLNNPDPGLLDLSQNGEDRIYGGDPALWVEFAHAIKARLYIHQSKGNAAMATNALAEIAQSFTSNADNAAYPFGVDETSANPMYQFNENRADLSFTTSTMATMMAANLDPRYDVLFDSTFSDVNGVGLGGAYGNPEAPTLFITYEELQFMAAEATLRTSGDFAAAQLLFTAGIQASMDRLGVAAPDAAAYLAAHGVLPITTVTDAINAVSYEEWISLYLNQEAFAMWRRNDAPALTPTVGGQIPRRLLIPQSEYTYNSANVYVSTLFSPKVFWDN